MTELRCDVCGTTDGVRFDKGGGNVLLALCRDVAACTAAYEILALCRGVTAPAAADEQQRPPVEADPRGAAHDENPQCSEERC